MRGPKIAQVRAYTVAAKGGADYHDQEGYHWIDDHISTPMAKYPGFADSRRSFGINVLGTLVVQIEADDGTVGFGVTTAGEIGAWIVEKHLARFLEGRPVSDLEIIWDQMYLSTLFYGRKGVVLNAISAVDLALYDLLGRIRQVPVFDLLGGPVRDELVFYATGARSGSRQAARVHRREAAGAPRPCGRGSWAAGEPRGARDDARTRSATTSGSCGTAG